MTLTFSFSLDNDLFAIFSLKHGGDLEGLENCLRDVRDPDGWGSESGAFGAGCDALKRWQGGGESTTSLLPAPPAPLGRRQLSVTAWLLSPHVCSLKPHSATDPAARLLLFLFFLFFSFNVSKCLLELTLPSENLDLLVLRLPGTVWCIVTLHCLFTKVVKCITNLWC